MCRALKMAELSRRNSNAMPGRRAGSVAPATFRLPAFARSFGLTAEALAKAVRGELGLAYASARQHP